MKTLRQSLFLFVVLSVILCGVYPAIVMGISNAFFHDKAAGGILTYKDNQVGAELIAQEFTNDKFFWSRPSAASFNASASSGSNYALTNADLQKAINERKAKGLDYDLLTTSGSGLDPHISPKAALLQVERVAKARGMDKDALTKIVEAHIEERQWGVLGEARVNVLKLNLDLENSIHE